MKTYIVEYEHFETHMGSGKYDSASGWYDTGNSWWEKKVIVVDSIVEVNKMYAKWGGNTSYYRDWKFFECESKEIQIVKCERWCSDCLAFDWSVCNGKIILQ